ncbi:hypothetical protein CAPTEDRAFT_150138 [Capitella teleta]|uniref:CRAL-TRIO domain-containing protein n=1 Tax=Capitella teleta TaxID=283909 RepID=R7UQ00_CAPTE|nr:hypothetical protein CAPTEDRAFT_150138 [Capitella teleta]|eukprot:ELU08275.1 hypothetical protein CAPTEDRAFT_150138 [Capitella teleta]
MSGYLGDLSPTQQESLNQIKKRLEDIWSNRFTDTYLLQWLRARQFDVTKSEKMLRDHLAWREANHIDTILDTWVIPEVIAKHYPGGFAGYEYDGTPIWIDCLGMIDLKGVFYSVSKKEIVKYKARQAEYLIKEILPKITNKTGGRPIEQVSLIFDMQGIGMSYLWKPSVDCYVEIMKMFEANYPETMKTTYLINAPKIFPILYNIIKPLLREETKLKLKILGSNWKEEIVKWIDPEHLPVYWGGKARDPDGDIHCKSTVCIGGKVPESMYVQNITTDNVSTEGFTKTTISRGSSLKIDVTVAKAGSMLRWNFSTDGMDIGFGVYRNPNKDKWKSVDKMEVFLAPERVNSHLVPEHGGIICEKAGDYVVHFDNSYSWRNTKKLAYLVEVLDPNYDEFINTDSFCTRI